jgi:hypothetical protein
VRRERLVPINTTYVYAHGKAKGGLIDVPENAVVFMQCNAQPILADMGYDMAKLVFALTPAQIQCNTFKEYVEKLQDVFNVNGALFCFYLQKCPNMDFSFNDKRVKLRVYKSTKDENILEDLKVAQKVNKAMFSICQESNPQNIYEQCVRDESTLDNAFDKLSEDMQGFRFNKFMEARELIYHIPPLESKGNEPNVTLQNIFDTLDKDKFHFIIVNTSRRSSPDNQDIMNVSNGVTNKQFEQYQEMQKKGKHSIVTTTALAEACQKIEGFNKNNQTQKVFEGGKQTPRKKKTETKKKK